ncbi:MAG: twin-arginine translocase subunit TatC [bacterium]|nr:twin-arginine translocase subunit TatC [Candidatus Limimorpha caballi]
MPKSENTFWGHVEVLRWVIIRCLLVIVAVAVAAFVFKEFIFDGIVLAPLRQDFATYELLCRIASVLSMPGLCPTIHPVEIININLTAQLFTHMGIAFVCGLVVAFPYLILEIWFFVKPALYSNEKSAAVKGAFSFLFLFFLGVATAYYIIFPLTLNFLGTYQVSATVGNQISLNSYISTFLTLVFLLGIVFEMPIVAYFFAKIGLLKSEFLKKYRKVAIVVIMILAALITPSTDAFTMILVVLPLWMLYEVSRGVVKRVEKSRPENI